MKATLLLVIGATGARAWRTHIVSHTLDADDSPSLMTALSSANLTANATILFEKGQTYNIFTPIKFPVLTNVEVRIEGNLTYPDDISVIQSEPLRITFDRGLTTRDKQTSLVLL